MILFRSSMPQLDLHGEDRIGAKVKVDNFLNDNYKIGIEEVAIIHGIGEGVLKKEVLGMLKNDKRVIEYNIDCFNDGCTLVKLSKNIDNIKKKSYNTSQILGGRM